MKRPNFNPTTCNAILAYVMAGAYPHVAAEAAGVPKEEFEAWLASATVKNPSRKYVAFRKSLLQAQAQARVKAEMAAFNEEPIAWLKSGPGKEREDSPGWSQMVKPAAPQTNNNVNILLHPQMQGLMASLLQILAPYPEARAAVARTLYTEELPALPSPTATPES